MTNPIKIEPDKITKNRVVSVPKNFFNADEYCDNIFIRKDIRNKKKRHSIIRERLSNLICLLLTNLLSL